MADLHNLLDAYVGDGTLPGAVGLVARGDTGTIAILLTQVAADSPVPPQWMRDFWRYATSAG